MYRKALPLIILLVFASGWGCVDKGSDEGNGGLSGVVLVDGSSTVFPLTEAVAEEFQIANPGVMITVGVSGTGGGFKKFCRRETDINDASRPIKESEIMACERNGVEYIEFTVAYDGVTVVVNPANDFLDYLTLEELGRIWKPGSTVEKWSDLRPGWPEREIFLAGPDTDSGTFDYFTETVVGKSGVSRSDYTASSDDDMLVRAVAGEKDALGYFGYAYYAENEEKLRAVPIDAGNGPVYPTPETIEKNEYPLSRPLFIYVNTESLKRPEVFAFVEYYLQKSGFFAKDVGYVSVSNETRDEMLERLK
ncbi:PBP superfamily domain protein [Candidatus Methanoperedenaceae archaeon GB50]|nr:MAG: PBP superfamily domain protein [Candidatus Methanoperedenaceae archaeon GB50]CAD7776819.1 PBP superfamily domain protein [Candidatus Methanoperedenaceae archaeon GB50]